MDPDLVTRFRLKPPNAEAMTHGLPLVGLMTGPYVGQVLSQIHPWPSQYPLARS